MKYARKFRKIRKYLKRRSSKRKSIRRLSRSIRKVSKKLRLSRQKLLYAQTITAGSIVNPYLGINICDYQNISAGPVFATPTTTPQSVPSVIHQKCKMDFYFDLENVGGVSEEGTIQFTVFLISLRDDANDPTMWNPNTGALSLSAGTDYFTNFVGGGSGGLVMLNTKKFKIHKMKKFVLTNHETALTAPSAQTQYGTNRRFSWTQRMGGYIRNLSATAWTGLRTARDPSKQFYVLIFNDNTLIDGGESPQVQFSAVHSFLSCA